MKHIFLVFLLLTSPALQAKPLAQCGNYFINHEPIQNAKYFSSLAKTQFLKVKGLHKNARGYAVIITTMLLTASVSSYISATVAKDYPFLTYFISQVSLLGIVVIGAPIWEPVSSYFRKFAFNIKNNGSQQNADPYLEKMWFESQEKFSLNSQMSRNVVVSALTNIQTTLYEANLAFTNGRIDYAIQQIASIAVRLRLLFMEIKPNDEHIALAFRSIFTSHLTHNLTPVKSLGAQNKNPDLKSEILNKISVLDRDFNDESSAYYKTLLQTWLD